MDGFIAAGIIGVGLGAQYALLALGFTLIFGILGVINFALCPRLLRRGTSE